MNFKVEPITKTCIKLSIGNLILGFSYQELVALEYRGDVYKTSRKFSTTTSKHISLMGYGSGIELDHETLKETALQILRSL